MKSRMHKLFARAAVFTLAFAMLVGAVTATASAQTVTTKYVASGTKWSTPLYIINSGVAGPTVWVIGGTHGNEPAGYKAAAYVKDFKIKKGRLIVLPQANKLAVNAFTRYVSSTGDLNRSYPTSTYDTPNSTLSKSIWSYMKTYRPTWLVDMHEGYDFHKVVSAAVGQTAIIYPNTTTQKVATMAINKLNAGISGTYHDFSLLKYPTPGSHARAAGQFLGAHAMTFETSVKQPTTTRINQQLTMVRTILSYLGMQ
ncbi:MAG: succinylglutamate desuccinylase/aspartoacylase family protein [Chloroflexota bacterium]